MSLFNTKKIKKTKKLSSKNSTKPINNTKTSKNSKNSKNSKSNAELCSKYKGKAIRGTAINWAYNKCINRNNWDACKTLPPNGMGMHRYFCE